MTTAGAQADGPAPRRFAIVGMGVCNPSGITRDLFRTQADLLAYFAELVALQDRRVAVLAGPSSAGRWTNALARYREALGETEKRDEQPTFERSVWDVDRRTAPERKVGVERVVSGLDTPPQLSGRLNRLYRSAVSATRAVPAQERLAEVFRFMLRQVVRAIGRLLSVVLAEPAQPDPPGQLVTAEPHVTRGPTPKWTVPFLSVCGRPALV